MSRNIDIKGAGIPKSENTELQNSQMSLSPEERSLKTAKLLERIDLMRSKIRDTSKK
jgi:hypothetical protein